MKNDLLNNLLFLDVEATGLDEEDRLVQVAYILNGQEYESLFDPGRDMSVRAMEVTHITNKHLKGKQAFQGSDFYNELKSHLENEQNIFIAHNAAYDKSMIEREGLVVGRVIDTYKVAQALDVKGAIESYRLQYLRYYLGIDLEGIVPHDALGDVKVLRAVFDRMYQKMVEGLSHDEVIEKMIRISSEPVLIKRISFGKHRGESVADVARNDRGYLEWLLTQKESDAADGDADEDWLHTLRHYLS